MEVRDPRQGDHLPDVKRLYAAGPDGAPVERPTPNGVVLLTQCCDLARGGSGDPLAAAVVELDDTSARNARSGRMPRYAPVDQLGGNWFVDFGQTGTLVHEAAIVSERDPVRSTFERTLLAGRVSRRLSRFAYPDEVQPFLQRLRKKIRQKAGSAESPLGQCLGRVQTIRVENYVGWDSPAPWSLTVVFVLREGELPSFTGQREVDDPDTASAELNALASQIAASPPGSHGLDVLWDQLADKLVEDAMTAADPRVVQEAVAEVLEEGEYSYFRFRRSADIDVDDLSDAAD